MKDFDKWNEIKKQIDEDIELPYFNEAEIWWCMVGINVGYEIFGKNEMFVRPVLIVKKYSQSTFFALPLTSKKKKNKKFHYPTNFGGREGSVLLDQGRTLDSRRLVRRLGKIGDKTLKEITDAFIAVSL